jgi:hypothetical protein
MNTVAGLIKALSLYPQDALITVIEDYTNEFIITDVNSYDEDNTRLVVIININPV